MELIKHRIAHYWAHRAEAFQTQRIREFEDEKHARWLAEFNRYIPHDRTLRVLDLGTGTGFFAFVFAAEGHDATGIDLTPDMIEKARETVDILGVDAQFEVMDAEQPDFQPETFDVLVTRNLTDNHAHKNIDPSLWVENEAISLELSAYQMPRPQWDVQLLVEAGFERVTVDMGVYKRIYAEIDEFYNPVPIFTIAAYKE